MVAITNEVLAEKIDTLNIRFISMEKKIDDMPSAFVSHEVLELKLGPIEAKIIEVDRRKVLQTWVLPIISAVTGSVITFLVISNLSR
jgi:hypothetical protein